ncbi:MAG: hypothetical protein ACREEE_05325, partial [Dongiaceae bacterium]
MIVAATLSIGAAALADQEASNSPHAQSDSFGRCYAKSLPDQYYGDAGQTRVYQVERDQDLLLDHYDWFAQQLYLQCNMAR